MDTTTALSLVAEDAALHGIQMAGLGTPLPTHVAALAYDRLIGRGVRRKVDEFRWRHGKTAANLLEMFVLE